MKIIIGGDVSVKQDCCQLFESADHKSLFNDVLTEFEEADRVIINLECAVTDKNTPIKKIGPNLNAPINTVKALKNAGVTDCVLANNHIFDFGVSGVKDTIEQLEKHEINYTGYGKNEQDARKNLILTDGKIKIAVIAVCEHEYSYALPNREGARAYDPYDTTDDIIEAKKIADYVIVIYHGGKENCRYPSPRLLKACRSMVKHGANVVLCQHSHCIGCYENYENGHILYGQGNFHFVCKKYEDPTDNGYMWNTGLLVKLDIQDTLKIEFIPTVVDGASIRLANSDESKKLLSELNERSKTLLDGTYYEHFKKFALSQQRYLIFPKEHYEEIAHYFDCEAHYDMCKEIYKTLNHTNEINNK
ncbi:MAG: CapA family protein [Clostridia bacterium]|nr:CapA family protein [Clostridia bacterium]